MTAELFEIPHGRPGAIGLINQRCSELTERLETEPAVRIFADELQSAEGREEIACAEAR
jgi:hypothetical protein